MKLIDKGIIDYTVKVSLLNFKKLGKLLAPIIIVLFAWYFITNIDDFRILLDINPFFIVLLIIANIMAIVSNGLFMKWSVLLFGKRINTTESIRVSLISSAGNYFAPAGSGLGFRAIYLKKRHDLSYSHYLSILFCNYVIVFIVSALLGLIALFLLDSSNESGADALLIFFSSMLVISVAALFVRTKQGPVKKGGVYAKTSAILAKVSEGWQLMLSDKKILLRLIAIVILNAFIMVLNTYFIMRALHLVVPFAGIILFSVIGSLSLFVNITPGNLGVKEAVYVVFAGLIGLGTAEVLSVSLVDRAVLFFVLLGLWLLYGRNLHKKMYERATELI